MVPAEEEDKSSTQREKIELKKRMSGEEKALKSRFIWMSPLFALISSSCCVIQLILNIFSFSCAGFSIMNPYRPLFTTFTILSISYNLYKYGINRITLTFLTLTILLAISPELVKITNEGGASLLPSFQDMKDKMPSKSDIKDNIPSRSDIEDKIPSKPEIKEKFEDIKDKIPSRSDIEDKIPSKSDIKDKIPSRSEIEDKIPSKSDIKDKLGDVLPNSNYLFTVDGIGCVSCANKIKNRLETESFVISSRVFIDNSTVIATTKPLEDYSSKLIDIIEGIDRKYKVTLLGKW